MVVQQLHKMTEKDQKNLEFLLASSPANLKTWWAQADEDDRMYAFSLFEMARLDLTDRQVDMDTLIQANTILSQFTLH